MADDGHQIKLLTIGDTAVGKSWLLLRWVGETNRLVKGASSMSTIGIDFKLKSVLVDGTRVKVQVWDTAGQERFRTITTSYYRNTQGILLVYDITDRATFNSIRQWMQQINLHADVHVNKILIGNKCDLIAQRAVSFDEGEALAREFQIPFYETSAMNDINVEEAFMRLAKDVLKRIESGDVSDPGAKKLPPVKQGKGTIPARSLQSTPPPKKSWC